MATAYETDASIIMSLHWFAKHNGARQFMVYTTNGGAIRVFNGSRFPGGNPWDTLHDLKDQDWDGSTLTRSSVNEPWQGEQSAVWGGRLYMANGIDNVIVYDGDNVTNAGFITRPSPPDVSSVGVRFPIGARYRDSGLGIAGIDSADIFTVVDGTANQKIPLFYSGMFRYRVSFVNSRGQESALSDPSTPVRISSDDATKRNCAFVQLPLGPVGTVARRVYRTRNLITLLDDGTNERIIDATESAGFYFLDEIPDNCTTEFEDGRPDSFLAQLVDPEDFGRFPTGVRYLAAFKNTMFYAVDDNTVRFSRAGMPEITPELNRFLLGSGTSGPITGMVATKNSLVVFKANGIYLIKGDPRRGFFSSTLTETSGCVASGSIQEVPGVGLVFLSREGVSVLDGTLEDTGAPTQFVSLSTPIKEYIDRINFGAALNTRSVVNHRDKEFWLCVPTKGRVENDLVLVFHYEIGEWSIREDFPVKCALETGDHRGYIYFGSHDTTKYGIYVYSRGYGDKAGTAIEPAWESIHHTVGSEYNVFQPLTVRAYAVAYGDNDLQLDYRINRSISDARSAAYSRDQQEIGDTLDVYNTAVWGTSTSWGHFRPVPITWDLSARDLDRVREFQVSFKPAGARVQLVGYDIEVASDEHRNILPAQTGFDPGSR